MRESSEEYDPADAEANYEADLAEEQRLRDRLLERARQREEDRLRDEARDAAEAYAAAEQRRRDDEIARKEWEEYERKKAATAAAIARREARDMDERQRQAAAAAAAAAAQQQREEERRAREERRRVEEQRRFEEDRRAAAAAAAERAARDRELTEKVERALAEYQIVSDEDDRRRAEEARREAEFRNAAYAQPTQLQDPRLQRNQQHWQQQQMQHHHQQQLQPDYSQPPPPLMQQQQPYPQAMLAHHQQLQHDYSQPPPPSMQQQPFLQQSHPQVHPQHHQQPPPPPMMQQQQPYPQQPYPQAHQHHHHQHVQHQQQLHQQPPLDHHRQLHLERHQQPPLVQHLRQQPQPYPQAHPQPLQQKQQPYPQAHTQPLQQKQHQQQLHQPYPLAHPQPLQQKQHRQQPPLLHEPPTGYRTPGRVPDEYPEIEPLCEEPIVLSDDEEEQDAGEYPMESVWKYKQPLSRVEMVKMVDARVLREKKKKPVRQRITESGQGEDARTDGVPLGHFEGSAVDDNKKIRVNFGVRPPKGFKGIKKIKSEMIPALLTDLQADKLDFSRHPKGDLLRAHLVNLQKSYFYKPKKQVRFAEGDDPRHKMLVYLMQKEQEWKMKLPCDLTDDGRDMMRMEYPMTRLRDVLARASEPMTDDDREFNREFKPFSTLQRRWPAGDVHVQPGKKTIKSGRLCYLQAGTTVPVSKRQDVIFTRDTAKLDSMRKDAAKRQEFTVSHRDYKILLAMRPMSDQIIQCKWLYTLRMYATHAFGCGLNRDLGTLSVANSGLSHLIFADSLLDRVNTFRFPQSHFVIHQKPLTLSSSFRMLCNHVPFENLVQIEWFIFAYGFDEIVFMGKEPKLAAETLIHHVLAIMRLYFSALTFLQKTHRIIHQAKFRVFKLPSEGMDKRLLPWIHQFNEHLAGIGEAMRTTASNANRTGMMPMMFVVLDWETPKILNAAAKVGKQQVKERNEYTQSGGDLVYRYHCMDSFVQATNDHCEMRTSRIYRDRTNEYHWARTKAKVHGLSEDEKNKYY